MVPNNLVQVWSAYKGKKNKNKNNFYYKNVIVCAFNLHRLNCKVAPQGYRYVENISDYPYTRISTYLTLSTDKCTRLK